jgi:hypothetical protein
MHTLWCSEWPCKYHCSGDTTRVGTVVSTVRAERQLGGPSLLAAIDQIFRPQPFVFFRVRHEPTTNGILLHVLTFLAHSFFMADHMVERFVLPNRAGALKKSVDLVRSEALNGLEQLIDDQRLAVNNTQWSEHHVHVFGHNDRSMQLDLLFVME